MDGGTSLAGTGLKPTEPARHGMVKGTKAGIRMAVSEGLVIYEVATRRISPPGLPAQFALARR